MADSGRLAGPVVLLVVIFAVAGSIWWLISLSHGAPRPAGTRSAPAVTRAAMPARATEAGLPVGEPRPTPAAAPGIALAAMPRTGGAVPAGEMQLALKFSAPSWVEVYDAGGHRLLYSLATAPGERTLEGRGPFTVLLGNAPGVTLEINGRPTSFAQFVRADHTARFLIAADGRAMSAGARADGG